MARLTVEDCLKHVDNRFDLVLKASKRARALERGAEAHVRWDNDKPTVVALREMAQGLLRTPEKTIVSTEEEIAHEMAEELNEIEKESEAEI